jgi:hypothetical protein
MPVAEPVINESQGLLITLGIIGLLLTPPDSGLLIRSEYHMEFSTVNYFCLRIEFKYWKI